MSIEAFGNTSIEADWSRTVNMHERLAGDARYEEPFEDCTPEGYFSGRPIIASDTAINGGVYLGGGKREAIVVDDDKYPGALNRVYDAAIANIYGVAESPNGYPGDVFFGLGKGNVLHPATIGVRERVLVSVFAAVLEAMPYSSEIVSNIIDANNNDNKVTLNNFIEVGGGVCRHQGLLVAYVLERLQNEGELMSEDKVSIDRNGVPGSGAHGWARFTSSDGTVYIVDPAQQFVGTLEEAQRTYRWPYDRPEDV